MPADDLLTDNIDLERAIYDPEYRRSVIDRLKAQRRPAPAGTLMTQSGSGGPETRPTPRVAAAGKD